VALATGGASADPVVAGAGDGETAEGAGRGAAEVGESAFSEVPAPPHATAPLAAESAMSAARPRRSIGIARTPSGDAGAPWQKGHRASDLRT